MSRVTDVYPLDGPHTPGKAIAAARDMAELGTYLTVATRHVGVAPAELAATVGWVGETLGVLPQLLRQLAGRADLFLHLRGLHDERGGDVAVVVRDLAGHLRTAATSVDAAKVVVGTAHEAASRLDTDGRTNL